MQLNTVATGAELTEWVENADRWVSGFLEKFEEGCHVMVLVTLSILLSKRFFEL